MVDLIMQIKILNKLRTYYDVHPLLFLRSCEMASCLADLYSILDTIPSDYPICWSESNHCWIKTPVIPDEIVNLLR